MTKMPETKTAKATKMKDNADKQKKRTMTGKISRMQSPAYKQKISS